MYVGRNDFFFTKFKMIPYSQYIFLHIMIHVYKCRYTAGYYTSKFSKFFPNYLFFLSIIFE